MTTVGAPDLPRVASGDRAAWIKGLGRFGLVAKGVSYGLVAYLALKLAFGAGGQATSRSGALATIASNSWGEWLLVALALGFAAYALWRLAETVWPEGDDGFFKRTGKRIGSFGRAAIYAGLTYSALKIAFGSTQQQSQSTQARRATAHVLSWHYGTWIVGIAGGCLIAAGLYNAYRGVKKKFTKRWETGSMSHGAEKTAERVGTAGLLARGVVFTLIGAFFIKAAVDYNPRDAIGLDGALQKLANQAYGDWLLGLVAVGLLAYAIFCLVEARYRRV
jgi:Domain of Unknown Function (DUF1206)